MAAERSCQRTSRIQVASRSIHLRVQASSCSRTCQLCKALLRKMRMGNNSLVGTDRRTMPSSSSSSCQATQLRMAAGLACQQHNSAQANTDSTAGQTRTAHPGGTAAQTYASSPPKEATQAPLLLHQ